MKKYIPLNKLCLILPKFIRQMVSLTYKNKENDEVQTCFNITNKVQGKSDTDDQLYYDLKLLKLPPDP